MMRHPFSCVLAPISPFSWLLSWVGSATPLVCVEACGLRTCELAFSNTKVVRCDVVCFCGRRSFVVQNTTLPWPYTPLVTKRPPA